MKSLQELFINDKETLRNFHAYQVEFLQKEAVRMIFDRENTEAIADAKELIDKSYENLDLIFQSKVKSKSTINESR